MVLSEKTTVNEVRDTRGRGLTDLRLSVTDRCNLRCNYCMPKQVFDAAYQFLPSNELLSYEEIARVVRVFAAFGTRKLRITGGEPLIRRELPTLVEMLSSIDGIDDIALTTNGLLLPRYAAALKQAGLGRLTVSLDALDDEVFKAINGRDVSVTQVLDGIEAATAVGFDSIKINCVVQRGQNDDQLLDLARHFRGTGHILRFIEFMDVGNTNGWKLDRVVSGAEILETIGKQFPLEPVASLHPSDVAKRFSYADGQGEIGVITSVSSPFCGACTRARLSARGELYTCLFSSSGSDLRGLIRSGVSDDELAAQVQMIWKGRTDRYSEIRGEATEFTGPRVEMSYIGG